MGVQSLGQKDPKGQRSLEGYSPWDCKEWGTTEHVCAHTHGASTSWISLFLQRPNSKINTKITFSEGCQSEDHVYVLRREDLRET